MQRSDDDSDGHDRPAAAAAAAGSGARMKELLASYYGMQQQQRTGEDMSSDVESTYFDPKRYVSGLLRNDKIETLLRKDDEMVRVLRVVEPYCCTVRVRVRASARKWAERGGSKGRREGGEGRGGETGGRGTLLRYVLALLHKYIAVRRWSVGALVDFVRGVLSQEGHEPEIGNTTCVSPECVSLSRVAQCGTGRDDAALHSISGQNEGIRDADMYELNGTYLRPPLIMRASRGVF